MTFEKPETDAYVAGHYRYWLTRTWDEALPALPWVMLNPSTADAETDDPTIRRVSRFSRDWGFGGILVMNLFAYRATDPAEMMKAADPVGPENDAWLDELVERQYAAEQPIVLGWGVLGDFRCRGKEWIRRAAPRAALVTLGETAAGCPKHPLYLPTEQPLRPYGGPL